MRSLGGLEQIYWLLDQTSPRHFSMAVEFVGHIKLHEFTSALRYIQALHPLLSVSIITDMHGVPYFISGTDPIPVRVSRCDELHPWEREFESELSAPFYASEGPLIRVVWIDQHGSTIVIFSAHHSIADGKSIVIVINDLMKILAGAAIATASSPPALEHVLAIQPMLIAEATSDLRSPSSSFRPGCVISKASVQKLRLSERLTEELRHRCRAESTTVHCSISAALASALLSVQDSNREIIRIRSAVDARPVLGLGPCCAFLVSGGTTRIARRNLNNLWEAAREIGPSVKQMQTLEALVRGRKLLCESLNSNLDPQTAAVKYGSLFDADIAVTNLGIVDCHASGKAFEVTSLWGPAINPRSETDHIVGVATVAGALHLLHTCSVQNSELLITAEQILTKALQL